MELRILLLGSLAPFLTTRARYDAFERLGVPIEAVDHDRFLVSDSRIGRSLTQWTLLTPGVFAFNRAILEAARRFRPNLIWIEKGVFVFPRTMRVLRSRGDVALVYHNTDDWRARTRLHGLHWRYLLRALPLYDLYLTSNLHNVREFQEHGFTPVHLMELAANEAIADPRPVPDDVRRGLGAPVGFVGHYEPVTEALILALVGAGIGVKVYGHGWERSPARHELGEAIQHRVVWGPEYAQAICSFDVNLGIVSKWNRNHTASRTFQIPALGAFLLHERNELVSRYFREGVEAEFFDSADEMVEKCRHYLAHPQERRRIAEAGRRRCVESGYWELDRVRAILPALEQAVRSRS